MANLRSSLKIIWFAKLKPYPAKCFLLWDKVLYLNNLNLTAEVALDFVKLHVFADKQKPTTVRKMQSFFGFVNFYDYYIVEATMLTALLNDVTASKKKDDSV